MLKEVGLMDYDSARQLLRETQEDGRPDVLHSKRPKV